MDARPVRVQGLGFRVSSSVVKVWLRFGSWDFRFGVQGEFGFDGKGLRRALDSGLGSGARRISPLACCCQASESLRGT